MIWFQFGCSILPPRQIALAVTKFKGFVGFAPPSDVVSRLRKIPELRDLAGRPTKGGPSTALPDEGNVYDLVLKSNGKDEGGDHSWKALMSAFMARILSASSDDTKAAVDKVARRAKADADSFAGDDELGDLILTLNEQHPGDVGVLFGERRSRKLFCENVAHCSCLPASSCAHESGDARARRVHLRTCRHNSRLAERVSEGHSVPHTRRC